MVVLYNIKFTASTKEPVKLEYREIYQTRPIGRLKLLRGNIIVFYSRVDSRGHLVNYMTNVNVALKTHGFASIVSSLVI